MTREAHSHGQGGGFDRQTILLFGLAVLAAVGGVMAARSRAVDGLTLYRGMMLTGLLALAYVRFRN